MSQERATEFQTKCILFFFCRKADSEYSHYIYTILKQPIGIIKPHVVAIIFYLAI
jgi:hypothetical protein